MLHLTKNQTNHHVVRALTIAGSDSGGGAGIQADLKTFHQFGIYGSSAITAITAQNTVGVQDILEIPETIVHAQLLSVLTDIHPDAVKIGMLANERIIRVVSDVLTSHFLGPIVVDPVMVAKGGSPLLTPDSVSALRDYLLPHAHAVTPNIPEAEVLCEMNIATWADVHQAAIQLAAMGPSTVVVKGGHMGPELVPDTDWFLVDSNPRVIDVVYTKGQFTYFVTPRVDTQNTHGTGCTFSAAMAAMLAGGSPMLDAIASAKQFVFHAIEHAKDWDVGQGHGPIDHFVSHESVGLIEAGGVYRLDGMTWTNMYK